MTTQWTITKDHTAEWYEKDGKLAPEGTNRNAVTLVGPRGATLSHAQIVAHPEGQKFRLYDDDEELYYEGVVVVGENEESILRPLDDFGTPNAGAVRMDVKQGAAWVTIN